MGGGVRLRASALRRDRWTPLASLNTRPISRFKANEIRVRNKENRTELNRVIAEWFLTMNLDEALATRE